MSGADIDKLMKIWAATHPDEGSPFSSHEKLYKKIDSIEAGDVPWQSITIKHPNSNSSDASAWQMQHYDVWFRDPKAVIQSILSNPEFKDGFDYAPCMIYNEKHQRIRSNFMSADWAWNQCVSEASFPNYSMPMTVLPGHSWKRSKMCWGNVCPNNTWI